MAGHREVLRRVYFSETSEGTHGTAEALTHFANLQSSLPNVANEWYSDTEEATGYEEETKADLLVKSARFTLSGRADDVTMPLLLSYAMGGDTSALVATKTGSYQHLLELAAVGTELLGFTCEVHAAGATDATAGSSRKYTGCMVDTFRLSGSRKGWTMFSADIIARGDYATGSSQTESGLIGPTVHYPVGMTNCWHATGGIEGSFSVALPDTAYTRVTDLHATGRTDLATLLRDYELTIANNLQADDGYTLDGNDVMDVAPPRAARVITLGYTLDYTSATAGFMNWANINTTTPAFEINCVTGTECYATDSIYHAFKVLIAQMQVKEITPGEANGQQTLAFNCHVQDDKTNDPMDIYVWNGDDADYGS